MKKQIYIRRFFFILLSVLCITSSFAQKTKKSKVRLKAKYVKVMESEIYFDIAASSKVKKKNIKVANIELNIYNTYEDEKILIGKTITNMKGKSRFSLKDLNSLQQDTITNSYNILITFKGDDFFKKAKKSIGFKNASLEAKLVTKDSVNYITATLKDVSTDSLISNIPLTVQLQRLFQPLFIGKEFNITDSDGTIVVPIEEGLPGIDGNLTFEVVLNDSDEYGTVIAIVNAPIGKHIVDESTFDERTMWSPRNKTPLFLLIFPNLLIFGVWGLIIYLSINLFKITKS
ncbi:MAG: hypothetical protein JKY16_00620 [Lutibacter sp.]|nr:hypothetical protein [Lutibacter sp.]